MNTDSSLSDPARASLSSSLARGIARFFALVRRTVRFDRRIVMGAVVALSLAYLALYLGCAALRLGFEWDLEWMEGGMVTHAARVLRGQPIYAPPSLDFVAFFYTPLYSYVLAGLSYLTGGLSFALARGVSLAASLLTMGMLFFAGRREAGLCGGLLAVGLYAALFRVCGAFYDLARADSLALALALAASLLAYYAPTTRGAAFSALLFVAAFFAKQTAVVPAPFVGLYLLIVAWRRAVLFGSLGILTGAGVFALLDRHYDGWLRFYTVTGHQGHAFYRANFFVEYWRDLLFVAPFLLLMPALGASYGRVTRWLVLPFLALFAFALIYGTSSADYSDHMYLGELWYGTRVRVMLIVPLVLFACLASFRALQPLGEAPPFFFLLLCLGGALASDLNHSTQWAYSNCFMPIATFGSLYAAITFAQFVRRVPVEAGPEEGERSPDGSTIKQRLAVAALALAMVVQLVGLFYDPRKQVPRARDRAALAKLTAQLVHRRGPVLMPAHPLYSFLRDGTVHLHQMGIGDVAFAGGLNDFDRRLASGEFPTVVEDTDLPIANIEEHYERVHTFSFKRDALMSRTGFAVRPLAIWEYRGPRVGTP